MLSSVNNDRLGNPAIIRMLACSRILVVAFTLIGFCSALAQTADLTIQSRTLTVRWVAPSSQLLLAARVDHAGRPSGRVFLVQTLPEVAHGSVKVATVAHRTFGAGQALEFSLPDGGRYQVMLFDSIPFALVRSSLHNDASREAIARETQAITARVDLGLPVQRLKAFGTGGLLELNRNPGSYVWMTIVEPESRNGVVLGWLTQDRGSGVLFTAVDQDSVKVEARVQYGRLRLEPGATIELETLAVGYFDDARLGLEAWADAVARVYRIRLPTQPTGYCTWYSQPNGGASDQQHLAELAAFSATNLAPFGFSVVQIDDKWQEGVSTNGPKRNFTEHRPSGPYPDGMKSAADKIKALGLVPGIWFMPFAGTYYDPYFEQHQDWFVKRLDGRPYETAWGGTCLDMTHPGAREHLRQVAHRICHDWGYQYLKVDGLWTGTATRQQYVNSGFKEDGMGDALFFDPDKTNIEAYRDGLRLLREAAGPKVFILGCNGPQNMRSYGGAFGLVDAMRIGPDNGSDWKRLLRGPQFGSRHYFLHGRIWYNDPDPVYVRASMPLNHARLICSWVALSGQLNLDSEWLPGLPPERLDILKRTMPSHGLRPRPADLFEHDPPRLWLLTDDRRAPRRDVIGIFNWDDGDKSFECPLERLGLDARTEYEAYDYWLDALLDPLRGRLQLETPAESCRIIAVRPRANHPQVISTSRHVTQGIVDLQEERWQPGSRMLTGRSRVASGDPYELRIVGGNGLESVAVSRSDERAGVAARLKSTDGRLCRVTFESPVSREVSWSIKFKP